MKKMTKIIIAVICTVIIVAGGFAGNMFGIFSKGNYGDFSLSASENQDSRINGKTIIFLGSSVTYGYGSLGVSFVDFLEEQDGIIPVKEAVSGTTLADIKDNSYVSRMKKIDRKIKADAFVCQLSTNDATKNIPLGKIAETKNPDSFDTQTIAGAIEYIIYYSKETWNCPVIFYTNPVYESENYKLMVDCLLEAQKKWDIEVIDLWNNDEFNNINEEERKLYLIDDIHPTKAGYCRWWLPEFRKCLYSAIN